MAITILTYIGIGIAGFATLWLLSLICFMILECFSKPIPESKTLEAKLNPEEAELK